MCLLAFSVGTSITWTSPVLPKLQEHTDDFFENKITSDQASWIASWLTLGMASGNVIFASLTTIMGRKACILTVAPMMMVSYLIMTFVNKVEFYYLARFLAGIGRIGGQVAVNMYMAEIVNKSRRGSVLGIITSFVVLGSLYSYTVGPYVPLKVFNLTLFVFPTLFLALFIFVGVETPHYHMTKGNKEIARAMLLRLRSKDENIEQELTEIEAKDSQMSNTKFMDLVKLPAIKLGFTMAFGLFFFQQFTGFYCIQFYNQQIFSMTGSSLDPEICAIIIGSLQFISGFLSSVVMERFPRKSLLYFSAIGMALSEVPLSIYCHLHEQGFNMEELNFLPLLFMSLFVLTYNTGYGPLPFIIPFEVFPLSGKGLALSIVNFVSAIINFFLAKYFQDLIDAISIGNVFLMFGICCLISIPFVRYCVVETRGKSLEAIQDEIGLKK